MQYYAERELYHICPPPLAERLQALPAAERERLEEVRLRLGYPAAMLSRGRETPLTGVAGLGTKTADDANGLFQSNYVLSTMTLGGAAFDGEGTDDANGTTKTPEAMADRATWEAQGFDLSEDGLWTWDASLSRPVFQGDAVPYGIYIVSEPIGATAYTNRAADFYVAAKGGIGTLTAQRRWQDLGRYQGRRECDEALPAGQAPLGRQPDPLQDHRRGRHVGIYGRRPADRRKRRLQCRDGGGSPVCALRIRDRLDAEGPDRTLQHDREHQRLQRPHPLLRQL